MLVYGHRTSGQGVTKARLVYLPTALSNSHRIVFADHPLGLDTEDPSQILPATASKGCALLLRGHRALAGELGDVTATEKRIGCFYAADVGQSKFLRQTALPGPEVPLRTSAGLW